MALSSAEEVAKPYAPSKGSPGTTEGLLTHIEQDLHEGLFNLRQHMTVFSKSCSMETSSQNENAASESADLECQEAVRSSTEFRQNRNIAPLKESSNNFDPPPRLQKSRSRTNAEKVEAAFEASTTRLNTAGSLHSRTHSGKLSPRKTSVSRRPVTAETRPATRDTRWTPRNTVTPSPAKSRPVAHSGWKGASAQKRKDWKVPTRGNRAVLTHARTLPLHEMKRSGEFKINASAGSP